MMGRGTKLMLLQLWLILAHIVEGFQPHISNGVSRLRSLSSIKMTLDDDVPCARRDFLLSSIAAALSTPLLIASNPESATAASLDSLHSEIKQARKQMNAVPDLIKAEKWDAVRAVLITPPLSDLWTKSARKAPLLAEFAESVGANPQGDELAVLEAKEDVEGHLRFLDMAVYNNVFNPIKSMGETGATKELIRSYYDDPINEYKASVVALDELIQLGNLN
jgi:hypothetical protein